MKKKGNKGLLGILIIVVVIIIVVVVIVQVNKNKAKKIAQNNVANQNVEEFVENLDDGTKLNNSNKLSESKTFEGLDISGIQITAKDNQTQLLATVTNNTQETKGNYPISITILDKSGNTITVAHGYIKELKAGENTQLIAVKTFDYANAYDFTISKD